MVHAVASESGYYTPIADRVLRAREDFLAWVVSLPQPIDETVEEMSRGNREGPLPGNLLGERDAFGLGGLLGASCVLGTL